MPARPLALSSTYKLLYHVATRTGMIAIAPRGWLYILVLERKCVNLFSKNSTLKGIAGLGVTSVVAILISEYFLSGALTSLGGVSLYYASLMLYRHYVLLKHDGQNGPIEDADERATSIAHEAGYRTFRHMTIITLISTWQVGEFQYTATGLGTGLLVVSMTIYTLIELHLRTEDASEPVSS